ncbi:MAG: valine--tRNA ligase [Planctomycetota bacterium]|nr:valine--tRNA ligase [Planctomycetota bacterium]
MTSNTQQPAELPKTYDPAAVEAAAYAVWMGEKCFHADPAAPGDPYSIVIPPPNVTGALHLGHAINNTLQDILIRRHRMAGYNTVWVPGIDHAGIATQAVVEKELKEKENKTRHDVGREALVERIWKWKEQYGSRILNQLQRLGCSCDWDRSRFTLDDMCARAVRETFFKLFKDGLIYRGKRLVNWDVFLQTSVSDDEIYYETVKTSLWHIKYPIVDAEGSGFSVQGSDGPTEPRTLNPEPSPRPTHGVVATTRPETMLGDTAVAVHPDDPRWNWAIGKSVRLPLMDRLIPIIADPILVNMEFGTGCVKVTPGHDQNDYACWQRHSDQIGVIDLFTPDGKINDKGGKYAGLKLNAARKQVVSDLDAQRLLLKEEPYETQVAHSDRSKTSIESCRSDQWFVKMAPLAEPALEVVRNGTIKFYPERHAQQYLAWLGEKRDWPISRQLWWGHRIPIWSKEFSTHAEAESLANEMSVSFECENNAAKLHELDGRYFVFVCLGDDSDGGGGKISSILEKRDGFTQDPDVLDTWFSSALWPHSTLGWPDNTPELQKYYPTSVLVTARDIITLWVARMVMAGLYNMGHNQFTANSPEEAKSKIQNPKSKIEKAIPFHHVAINPTILDGKGERMSKSKGNGVDPVDIIDTHGADALRFTLTQMATETQDARLPVKRDAKGRNTSDKFDVGRNFCNKIWNATRFALQNLANIPAEPVDEAKWTIPDRWILSRLMRAIKEADAAIAEYRFDVYAKTCYDFFWRDLCDWYIEAIKPELKDGPRRGQVANILAAALDVSMRLMHPMIPFITETIWWKLNEIRPDRSIPNRIDLKTHKRLILSEWPQFNDDITSEGAEFVFSKLQELIAAIRNVRNEYKVDQKKPVTVSIVAPGDAARQIEANKPTIELLATCAIRQVESELPPPPNSARTQAAGCEIFLENLVDADAEKQRTAKRRDELARQIATMKGRLTNEAYISKAPANLVQQTRRQLADAEAELAKLG